MVKNKYIKKMLQLLCRQNILDNEEKAIQQQQISLDLRKNILIGEQGKTKYDINNLVNDMIKYEKLHITINLKKDDYII